MNYVIITDFDFLLGSNENALESIHSHIQILCSILKKNYIKTTRLRFHNTWYRNTVQRLKMMMYPNKFKKI